MLTYFLFLNKCTQYGESKGMHKTIEVIKLKKQCEEKKKLLCLLAFVAFYDMSVAISSCCPYIPVCRDSPGLCLFPPM